MSTRSLVILTGAGISAESGISTFRDEGGLWCSHRIEDVATPEAFARNPKLVHEFYNLRRRQLREVAPNAAHGALAELASRWQGECLLVTQNVDNLHERALASVSPARGFSLLHMHGELTKIRCAACEEVHPWEDDLSSAHACAACGRAGYLRPHIVWFGEMPLELERISRALAQCDLFLSIGTSGNVYPAAGFAYEVRAGGRGRCVELNLEPSQHNALFHEVQYGPATAIVPGYVEALLAGRAERHSLA